MNPQLPMRAIALSLLFASGCQAPVQLHRLQQPLFALGQADQAVPAVAANLPAAASGRLTVRFDGALAQLSQGRRIQATVADVDKVVVTVTPQGGAATSKTVLEAAITGGQTSVSFDGLPPGAVTITISAFDAAGGNIGAIVQAATVAAGLVTTVDMTLQLNPTFAGGGNGGGGTPTTGGLATSITISDGPTLPSPTPGTLLGRYMTGFNPWGISLDRAGNAWVIRAGFQDGKMVQVAPNGTTLRTVSVGMGLADVAVDAQDQVWVLDIDQFIAPWLGDIITLYRLSSDGTILGSEAVPAVANRALVSDPNGNVWLMLDGGSRLRKMAASGAVAKEVVLAGAYGGYTEGFAVAPNGEIWVAYPQSHQVRRYDENGAVLSIETLADGGQPSRLVVDADGVAWVTAYVEGPEFPGKLMKFGADGRLSQTFDLGYNIPSDLVAHQGAVWASSGSDVYRLAPGGNAPALVLSNAETISMAAGSSGIWLGYPDLLHLAP